jgi:hypothetical protein
MDPNDARKVLNCWQHCYLQQRGSEFRRPLRGPRRCLCGFSHDLDCWSKRVTRERAADMREQAAVVREKAAVEREEASVVREKASAERENACLERETALRTELNTRVSGLEAEIAQLRPQYRGSGGLLTGGVQSGR